MDLDGTKLLVVSMTFLEGVGLVCKKLLVKDLDGTTLLVVGVGLVCEIVLVMELEDGTKLQVQE